MSASVNGEVRVRVSCAVCTMEFFASPRSARDYQAGRTEPRCMLHRKRGNRNRREVILRAEYRRFWLDRFSRDEIVEIAHALFPRGTNRGLPTALTAAAREAEGLDPIRGRRRD